MFSLVRVLLPTLLLVVLGGCAMQRPTPPAFFEAAAATKPYADVLAELELAITERNFRITGHNRIGSGIREREPGPFPDYDTIQFCNLTLARKMLSLSPAAVIYMPCTIAVRQEGDKVVVSTHLLPTDSGNRELDEFFRDMNEQLKAIVRFAVEE